MTGQPDFNKSTEYCININKSNGRLNDVSCDLAGVIPLCKVSGVIRIQNMQRTQPTVATCPTGWFNYSGHCYLIGNSIMTQYAAQAYCNLQYNGAFLAVLKSQAEIDSIATKNVWVNKKKNFFFI